MPDESPAEFIDVSVTLNLATASMRVTMPVPAGQASMTDLLPILQNFTSGVAQHSAENLAGRGEPVQCGPRCGACCRQLVPISAFEAEALGNWLRSLPPEQQNILALRFRDALLALQQHGVLSRLTPEMFSLPAADFTALGLDYFTAGVPCPFLIDESCSIHPIRPLVCREYMVVSPPEFCAEPGHARALGVVLPIRPSRALIKLGNRVFGSEQGWLPLVYLISWMSAGTQPGKAVTGTGPAVLEQFINAL